MSQKGISRRGFLGTATVASAVPYFHSPRPTWAREFNSANDKPRMGAIGTGGRGTGIARNAVKFSNCVAVCDVDRSRAERAKKVLSDDKADMYSNYQELIERSDVDLVTIGTPDHWHTKIAIEALHAGKDVYCEKPLTLTIDEGKQICAAVKETGRVFQVGTQQRSEMGLRFLTAVAICHSGRIGKIKKITCAIGGAPKGGPFKEADPPEGLDWDMWLGQAPMVPYVKERCHYQFRWWYAYSGGKMTDWGAHHVDIAQWAMDALETGPLTVEGVATHPNVGNAYNTATDFEVNCQFANGVHLVIVDKTEEFGNGIKIEGEDDELFVSRGKLTGKPVDALKENPLPEDALVKVYKGKQPGNHMANFFECLKTREQPISDVFTHHRSLSTCHLANIAIRTGRRIQWNPETEQIEGDGEAHSMLARYPRPGYEIDV